MISQATAVTNRYQPVAIDLDFIMSARTEITAAGKTILRDLYDQDCIHNDKKILTIQPGFYSLADIQLI